ncbi:MAG: BRO-N domain-containing protein [Janthinobacterium lividum]
MRVIDRDGVPWFVAVDVCRALGLTNAAETVSSLDDDEKGISTTDTLGGHQEVIVISESGLYALVFKSRKPQAIRFRKWVTAEVLPAIRTQGRYEFPAATTPATPPEALKIRLVSEARQTFGTQAAAQLWHSLSLPLVAAMHLPGAQRDLFAP